MLLMASWSEVSIVYRSEAFSSAVSDILEIYGTPASSESGADICVLIEESGRDG